MSGLMSINRDLEMFERKYEKSLFTLNKMYDDN